LFTHYYFFCSIVSNSVSKDPFMPVLSWLPVSFWHDPINLWTLCCFLAQWDIPGSPCTFSAPALESAKAKMLFRNKDLGYDNAIFGHHGQAVCPAALQDQVCAYNLRQASQWSPIHASVFSLPASPSSPT
jgi:hypothetical protein